MMPFLSRRMFWLVAVPAFTYGLPYMVAAQSAIVKIPPGEPMSPNPVAMQAAPVKKTAIFSGVERTWYEYVPASYTGKAPVPLVVAVHGGSADGLWMLKATAWPQIADQQGFIVIYPNGSIGSGDKLRWNAYPEFNTDPGMAISSDNGVDEAKFFKELIEKTEQSYNIDKTRVYMHGQSNGGMMTSYFGLRYPEMAAAIGVGSAPPSIEVMSKYPVHTKLPMYFWSGETDTVAGQYNPAGKSRAMICREFAEFWARNAGANMAPKLRLDGPYNTLIYSGDAEVRSTEFRNGIHTLPFTAAYMVWNDFFIRYARGKNGEIVHLTPDSAQNAGPDQGAVAVKLNTPFALVDSKVVRVGNTLQQLPALMQNGPSSDVFVPADFAARALGGTVASQSSTQLAISIGMESEVFAAGKPGMTLNGKPNPMGGAPALIDGEWMVPLRSVASAAPVKRLNTRKDVYRNDIYYLGDRPADLSAQTITFLDSKLGKSE